MTPWALGFLGLMIPVVALYFLKLKRKRVPVSSTWLWFRSINDLRVNAPFQRLRRSLLLLLQLLLIALAALALARPLGESKPAAGKLWVFLIDRSASMAMTDTAPSRLEEAKRRARQAIRAAGNEDQVMIIAFASRPDVVVPATRDRDVAERALDSIRPAETATRVTEAFQVAVSNARHHPDAEILLYSDGDFESIRVPAEGVPVQFVPVGARARNAAITALKVEPPRLSEDPWTIFTTVDLFSDQPAAGSLEIYVNGALKSVEAVELAPGESRAFIVEATQPVPQIVEARLLVEDHLEADNRAWQVVDRRVPRILAITQGNFFLEQALAALPDVEVSRPAIGDLGGIFLRDFDVVVCDGRLPPQVPEGRYLFFNCLPAWEGFALGEEIPDPPVVDWYRRHAVTRDLTFSGLNIRKAERLTVPEYALPLVETTGSALIAGWERGDTRAVIVAFDMLDSDWTLRPSFPLFVSNCVEWLLRGSGRDPRAPLQTGDSIRVSFGPEETQLKLTLPGGEARTLEGTPNSVRLFAETERAGLYTIGRAAGPESHAVNLMDARESAGRVAGKIEIDQETISGAPEAEGPPREWWWAIAWGVLALLLVEWFVYHRRVELF
jgi:hypothetical protein